MATLAAACLLLAMTHNAYLLVAALFGLRLAGQGMMSHASVTAMARAFTRHRGRRSRPQRSATRRGSGAADR